MIRRADQISDATVNETRTITATGQLIGTYALAGCTVLEIRVANETEIEIGGPVKC